MRDWKSVLAAACLLMAPAAFANEPLRPARDAAAAAEAGAGRVFGRVLVVEGGKERPVSAWTEVLRLRIRSLATGQTQVLRIEGGDGFVWPLKPGEYVIQSVLFRQSIFRLWAGFTVPESGRAAYIGDLRAIVDGQRIRIAFADTYEETLKGVEARLAEAKAEPIEARMRPERDPGSYARVTWICGPEWQLKCDRNYQGVQAVLPEGAYEGFPRQATRTPLFEWKPSQAEGVAYDLAIYDAFLPESVLEGRRHERAGLVHYAEGLAEPRLQLDAPLAPGRKYMWSVRLRKGDVVSNWTTTSYFTFFLVGSASGSGQWYGFETPEQ
jgi:hypothetical protein